MAPHRAFKGVRVARDSPARTTQIPIEEQSSDIRVSRNYLSALCPQIRCKVPVKWAESIAHIFLLSRNSRVNYFASIAFLLLTSDSIYGICHVINKNGSAEC
jgi:hypothetical protein